MDIDSEKILDESKKINLMYLEAKANNLVDLESLKSQVSELYKYTSEKLPSVVTISLGDSYDYDRLKFMLNMHSKVKSNEVTPKEGDIQVGQVLVDDIVKPSLKDNK